MKTNELHQLAEHGQHSARHYARNNVMLQTEVLRGTAKLNPIEALHYE